MASIFDVITTRETPAGDWTRSVKGVPVDRFDRAFESQIVDICAPGYPLTQGPDVSFGDLMKPFAIVGHATAPTRCTDEEFYAITTATMAAATEHRVSSVLWFGPGEAIEDYEHYLTHPDIHTVARGTNYVETVAAVLGAAYTKTPAINPVLHLGFEAALALGVSLQNLTIPFAVGVGYPVDAVAVTDRSVSVSLTPIEQVTAIDAEINRRNVELTRFGAVEFDTTKAVRAADAP